MRTIDDIRRDDAAGYPQVDAGHAPLFSDIRVLLAEVDRLNKQLVSTRETPTLDRIHAAANTKRIGLGWSWRQVAKAVGLASSTLCRWGQGRAPSAGSALAVWEWSKSDEKETK